MRSLNALTIAFAVLLYLAGKPAYAQYGHAATGHSLGSHTTSHGSSGSKATTPRKTTSEKLNNTKLASKLEGLLPQTNPPMTAQQACSGFKNLGQCVAAIHVAHNLGISFTDLKAKMLGTSTNATATSKPESLGKAIQDLKPGVDAKSAVGKAKKQAAEDMKESES